MLNKGPPRKATIEDMSDALAAPTIITPHALPMFRDGEIARGTKRKREKDRMDPRKSHRPELPVTGPGKGGRVGASATQHVVQNLVRDTTRDEDVRAVLLFCAFAALAKIPGAGCHEQADGTMHICWHLREPIDRGTGGRPSTVQGVRGRASGRRGWVRTVSGRVCGLCADCGTAGSQAGGSCGRLHKPLRGRCLRDTPVSRVEGPAAPGSPHGVPTPCLICLLLRLCLERRPRRADRPSPPLWSLQPREALLRQASKADEDPIWTKGASSGPCVRSAAERAEKMMRVAGGRLLLLWGVCARLWALTWWTVSRGGSLTICFSQRGGRTSRSRCLRRWTTSRTRTSGRTSRDLHVQYRACEERGCVRRPKAAGGSGQCGRVNLNCE